jgi:hypothetical protein
MIELSASIRRFFELNRTFDLFGNQILQDLDAVLTRIKNQEPLPPFYYVMPAKWPVWIWQRLKH